MEENLTLLLEQIKLQEESAFEELYQRYYPRIYKAAYRYCKNDEDAQDIVHMTFLQVRRAVHTIKKPSSFSFWLKDVCDAMCENLSNHRKYDLYDDEFYQTFEHIREVRKKIHDGQSERMLSDLQRLMKMIQSLPSDCETILYATYFQRLSLKETSDLYHIPLAIVKSKLYDARVMLQEAIEAYKEKEQISFAYRIESLGACYLSWYVQKQLVITEGMVSTMDFHHPRQDHFFSNFPYAFTGCIVFACISAIIFANVRQSTQDSLQHSLVFPNVQVSEHTITTAQDAYTLLKEYAQDVMQLDELSQDQLEEIYPVYTALKHSDSDLFQRLKLSGWTERYERLMDTMNSK